MQNFPKRTLVIDVRTPQDYQHMRLHHSINIPYCDSYSNSPSIPELRSHVVGDLKLFDNRRRLLIIIVYSPPAIVFSREIDYILRKDKCKEVHILDEEFETFADKYPFLCLGSLMQLLHLPKCGYPSEIIPFQLFLGDYRHAEEALVIDCLKITHILNATNGFEAKFGYKRVTYLRLGVEDLETADISRHFNMAYSFISSALKNPKNRVLVHCAQGVSRSVTYVIMYLMKSRKICFEEALGLVKLYREVACPNEGFAAQLKNLNFSENSEGEEEIDFGDKVMID